MGWWRYEKPARERELPHLRSRVYSLVPTSYTRADLLRTQGCTWKPSALDIAANSRWDPISQNFDTYTSSMTDQSY
jgi:hypothetical protein